MYFKLKKPSRILGMPAELLAGFTARSYSFGFDGVEGLEAEAVGVFGDLVVYPFNGAGFFSGVRVEPFNMNWVSEASVRDYQAARNDRVNDVHSGSCAFLQIGYKQPISKGFSIRLYGQPGIQQFNVSNGTSTMGSYIQTNGTADFKKESQVHFIYNVNLGIEIRL